MQRSVPLLPWMITLRFVSLWIPDLAKDKPLNLRSISSQQKKVTFLVIVITSLIFFRWYVMDMSNQKGQVFPNKPQCSYRMSSPTTPNELPSFAFGETRRHLPKWTHVPRLVPFRKSHSCGPWSRPIEELFVIGKGRCLGKRNKKYMCSSHLRVIRFQRQKEINLHIENQFKKQTGFQQEWQMLEVYTFDRCPKWIKKIPPKSWTPIVLKDWRLSHCQMHMFLPSLVWLLICLGPKNWVVCFQISISFTFRVGEFHVFAGNSLQSCKLKIDLWILEL